MITEKRILWTFMVMLLVMNIVLLVDRRDTATAFDQVRRQALVAHLESRYNAEEEALLVEASVVPPPLIDPDLAESGADLQFLLLASIDDCTNCIEDEFARLNEMSRARLLQTIAVRAIIVDADREPRARAVLANLTPAPEFQVSIEDVMTHVPKATTPLVLVVRISDGRILDAHKPIPENLSRRDAFYERWRAILDPS